MRHSGTMVYPRSGYAAGADDFLSTKIDYNRPDDGDTEQYKLTGYIGGTHSGRRYCRDINPIIECCEP